MNTGKTMKKPINYLMICSFLFIAACVTINVYFPAAEVESAAEKIVEDILSDEQTPQTEEQGSSSFDNRAWQYALNPLNWVVSSAHAQANINLSSPAINALRAKIKSRYNEFLKGYLDQQVVGFNNKGFVEVIDAGKVGLKDRQQVKKLVADENRDRAALYREIAVANGHAEWEQQIRQTFVKQWISQAKSGWKYQTQDGSWLAK